MDEKEAPAKGHIHPISQIIAQAAEIFGELGFNVVDGPEYNREIESERYNFDMLNVPQDHPSRDMQDTFWVKDKEKTVMRTHTSPVQIRYMEKHEPPIRIIAPGKVFRNEATDATHEAQFHQIEGLVVDEKTSMAELKGTLLHFAEKFFGEDSQIRLRPSFFPFVEPGLEVDITCFRCRKEGCPVCKHSGWIEVLGAGMVHPKVLSDAGINPRKYRGFAFGVGVDRLAMIKYGVPDIRMFYSGDLRIVNQF